MSRTYQLTKTLVTEYEWDRGPMPSGYAQLTLQIQPTSSEKAPLVTIRSERIWRVRPTEYAKKTGAHEAERLIARFMPTIIKGVRQGVEDALTHSLKYPVTNITAILEQVTVDLMYSTEMAFHMAAKLAIQKSLAQAEKEGFLKTIPED
jgi:translation elongation factor EF-G